MIGVAFVIQEGLKTMQQLVCNRLSLAESVCLAENRSRRLTEPGIYIKLVSVFEVDRIKRFWGGALLMFVDVDENHWHTTTRG